MTGASVLFHRRLKSERTMGVMQFTYLVANKTRIGGWQVAVRDGEDAKLGAIDGELQRQLTKLHADGWTFVSTAATDNTLTVIFNKVV